MSLHTQITLYNRRRIMAHHKSCSQQVDATSTPLRKRLSQICAPTQPSPSEMTLSVLSSSDCISAPFSKRTLHSQREQSVKKTLDRRENPNPRSRRIAVQNRSVELATAYETLNTIFNRAVKPHKCLRQNNAKIESFCRSSSTQSRRQRQPSAEPKTHRPLLVIVV